MILSRTFFKSFRLVCPVTTSGVHAVPWGFEKASASPSETRGPRAELWLTLEKTKQEHSVLGQCCYALRTLCGERVGKCTPRTTWVMTALNSPGSENLYCAQAPQATSQACWSLHCTYSFWSSLCYKTKGSNSPERQQRSWGQRAKSLWSDIHFHRTSYNHKAPGNRFG